MRIVCCSTAFANDVLIIPTALRNMGHDVYVFNTDSYTGSNKCSILTKRLDSLGIKYWRNQYIKSKCKEMESVCTSFKPDVIIWISIFEDPVILQYIKADIKQIVWLVEGLKDNYHLNAPWFKVANKISVFDPKDVDFITIHHSSIPVEYVPLGYNVDYENIVPLKEKEYDVAFVGRMDKARRNILERVAEYALTRHLKTMFVGPLQLDTSHFWKRYAIGVKNPNLIKIVHSGRLKPSVVAEIYSKSKIVLNLGTEGHEGLNPRTFEIMATGAFELMDAKKDYKGLVTPGVDLDVFNNAEQLVELLDKYLNNDELRESMAARGYEQVINKMSMRNSIKKVLNLSQL